MWQKMTSMHQLLLQIISDLLRNEQCPMWQTLGRTVLIGKKNKILDRPEHFRPITCLSIIYKIQTSLVNTVLRSHIFSNNIWPFEQLGTTEKTLGAKEAIIFDRVINREVRMYKRNLYVGWTDVKKAYDSVFQEFIIEMLNFIKAPKWIIEAMRTWRTMLQVKEGKQFKLSREIEIDCGNFQGDLFKESRQCGKVYCQQRIR